MEDGTIERFPTLSERVRNWQPIATLDDKTVIHVNKDSSCPNQMARIRQDAEYLGRSYKAIAQKAKQGDAVCQQVIDEIISTAWEEDNPDPEEGPPRITHHGKLKEWKAKLKPPKLSNWLPVHVWLGHDVETPDDDDMED